MKMRWKRWLAVICIAAATAPVLAQQKQNVIVVDGSDWLSANGNERRAFLVGAANMIVAEMAYAKRTNRDVPPVAARITKATEDLRIADIEARITAWYRANPGRLTMPVMGVVWQDIAKEVR